MLILAIDTTSPSGSVALLRDLELLRQVSRTDDAPYSSRLFQDVDQALREAGAAMAEVELFAVATGPGSFTSVRVGLAAVKAWAEVYRRPIAAVSALEAMAAQASPDEVLVAGISDAHRGQLFAGLYERNAAVLRRRGEDVVMAPAECFAYLAKQAGGSPFVIRTTAPGAVNALVEGSAAARPRVEAADLALASSIGSLGYSRSQRGELTDALHLDAHYVRRSDAELLWRGR